MANRKLMLNALVWDIITNTLSDPCRRNGQDLQRADTESNGPQVRAGPDNVRLAIWLTFIIAFCIVTLYAATLALSYYFYISDGKIGAEWSPAQSSKAPDRPQFRLQLLRTGL